MFVFYDFETTGTSPSFDQPIQFAAILTDYDFNQVERVDIRCRLSPHILPAPWAMAVTGVTPEQLIDLNLPSWFDCSDQIRGLIKRWAPATWTGYNSIAFDEEFLRQPFYQNLHPNIYQTQFDHNDRLDLMKVIYAVWDRAPDILEWPRDENDRISFKLDRLAPASGFTAHNAHDALGDVEATIYMASLIRDRAPAVWAQCLRNQDKNEVSDTLNSGQPLLLIERFGAAPPLSYLGVYAGTNPQNRNAMGFLDLEASNVAELVDADDVTLAKAVSGSPKLIRTVSINKVPNIFTILIPKPVDVAAAKLVGSRSDFQKRVGQALADRFADRKEPDHVEKQIYGGFYSAADKHILEEFEAADWRRRAELVAKLEDARLRQLGRRLIYWNAPELVSESYAAGAQAAIWDRWMSNEPDAPWMTKAKVEKQLDEVAIAGAISPDQFKAISAFYQNKLSN
ncbi:exonuclease domain-containing protein [Sulfitobacter pontiacus]|uniref:exonuclease domain-containing protein n=1 Tax=Sulfitobacter pontiacus TaxID=60137 RepID=UPI00315B32AF